MPDITTNWFETGVTNPLYVCDNSGNDGNAGTKPLPKQTINGTVLNIGTQDIVFRRGLYNMAGSLAFAGYNLIGDSELSIIDGGGIYDLGNPTITSIHYHRTIHIRNVANLTGRRFGTAEGCHNFINSIVENFTTAYVGLGNDKGVKTQQTLFKNGASLISRTGQSNVGGFTFARNTYTAITEFTFVSDFDEIRNYSQCYFENSNFKGEDLSAAGATMLVCSFLEDFQVDGVLLKDIILDGQGSDIKTLYADGVSFSGTYTSLLNSRTIVFTDCFWTADAGFITGTFIPELSSILNSRKEVGQIGKHTAGQLFDANHQAFDPLNNAIYSGVTRNTPAGTFTQTVAGVTGTVTSSDVPATAIKTSTKVTPADAIRVLYASTLQPSEVVDKLPYNNATNLEVRQTLEVKYHDGAVWSAWIDQEIGNKFGIETDALGVGNGDVTVDVTTLSPIGVFDTWMVRKTLRTDGV